MVALLADGADVNEPMTGGSGATALFVACGQGHAEVVTTLLASNASVDEPGSGMPPLFVACFNGRTEIVAKLLDAGASVDLASMADVSVMDL